MPGQPVGFDVVSIVPTEPATAQSPALVIQAGDSITLETYLYFRGAPFEKASLDTYLTTTGPGGAPEAFVAYHLQDLITGAMVPTILGGTITAMTAAQVTAAVGAGKLPAGSAITSPALEGFWVSAATAPISTGAAGGAAATLVIPAGFDAGTWRVLAHVHPADPARHFAAFDDNLVIEVIE